MPINETLSYWDALHTCYCGRWRWQPSPARSKGGIAYERAGRKEQGEPPRVFAHRVDVSACEVCGYDLTSTPRDNLAAIPPEEWAKGEIVGSSFSHECEVADFLPAGVDIAFARCVLDNVVLPGRASMAGKSKHWQGVVCSHDRIIRQNDGRDWVCRWKAAGEKAAGTPVQPCDYAAALLEGCNVDPEQIPSTPLTADDMKAEQVACDRWKARVENARSYVAEDGWMVCTCVVARKTTVEAKLGKTVPERDVMPDRGCKLCGGCGATPPTAEVSSDGVSR